MTRVDLSQLERAARDASTPELWRWREHDTLEGVDTGAVVLYASCDENDDPLVMATVHDRAHIAAASPPVVLALIARIRELEAFAGIVPEVALTADKIHRDDWPDLFVHTDDGNALYLCDARDRLLMKGTVIP